MKKMLEKQIEERHIVYSRRSAAVFMARSKRSFVNLTVLTLLFQKSLIIPT